jgi:hypothetical protein
MLRAWLALSWRANQIMDPAISNKKTMSGALIADPLLELRPVNMAVCLFRAARGRLAIAAALP